MNAHLVWKNSRPERDLFSFSVCIQLEELNYKNLHDWQREIYSKKNSFMRTEFR